MDNTWKYYEAPATTQHKARLRLHKICMDSIYAEHPELFETNQRNQLVRYAWHKYGDGLPVESILRWAREIKKNTEIEKQISFKQTFYASTHPVTS